MCSPNLLKVLDGGISAGQSCPPEHLQQRHCLVKYLLQSLGIGQKTLHISIVQDLHTGSTYILISSFKFCHSFVRNVFLAVSISPVHRSVSGCPPAAVGRGRPEGLSPCAGWGSVPPGLAAAEHWNHPHDRWHGDHYGSQTIRLGPLPPARSEDPAGLLEIKELGCTLEELWITLFFCFLYCAEFNGHQKWFKQHDDRLNNELPSNVLSLK